MSASDTSISLKPNVRMIVTSGIAVVGCRNDVCRSIDTFVAAGTCAHRGAVARWKNRRPDRGLVARLIGVLAGGQPRGLLIVRDGVGHLPHGVQRQRRLIMRLSVVGKRDQDVPGVFEGTLRLVVEQVDLRREQMSVAMIGISREQCGERLTTTGHVSLLPAAEQLRDFSGSCVLQPSG